MGYKNTCLFVDLSRYCRVRIIVKMFRDFVASLSVVIGGKSSSSAHQSFARLVCIYAVAGSRCAGRLYRYRSRVVPFRLSESVPWSSVDASGTTTSTRRRFGSLLPLALQTISPGFEHHIRTGPTHSISPMSVKTPLLMRVRAALA